MTCLTQPAACTVSSFMRLSTLSTRRPRRHAIECRSSPSHAGSYPMTSGPDGSHLALRALATSAGGMKLSRPVISNASAAVAGYSCLNSAGSFISMIRARRHAICSVSRP